MNPAAPSYIPLADDAEDSASRELRIGAHRTAVGNNNDRNAIDADTVTSTSLLSSTTYNEAIIARNIRDFEDAASSTRNTNASEEEIVAPVALAVSSEHSVATLVRATNVARPVSVSEPRRNKRLRLPRFFKRRGYLQPPPQQQSQRPPTQDGGTLTATVVLSPDAATIPPLSPVPEITSMLSPEDKDRLLQMIQLDAFRVERVPAESDGTERVEQEERMAIQIIDFDSKSYSYDWENVIQTDRDLVLAIISKRRAMFEHVEARFKNDKQIVLQAVLKDPSQLQYAGEEIKDCQDFILRMIQHFAKVNKASTAMKSKIKIRQDAVPFLPWISDALKANPTIMMAAVRKDGLALKLASPSIQSDRSIVLAAVSNTGLALEYASNELQADEEVVKSAVDNNRVAMIFVSSNEIVKSLVAKNGEFLEHAPEDCKADAEIVLEAIGNLSSSVKHASPQLLEDKSFWLRAAKKSDRALLYSPKDFQRDTDFVKSVVAVNPSSIICTRYGIHVDKEVLLEAISKNTALFRILPRDLKGDKDIASLAIKETPSLLKSLPAVLKADRALVLMAVKKDGMLLADASSALRADKEIVGAAVVSAPSSIQYALGNAAEDKDIVLRAVERNGLALQFALEKHKADREIVMAAVKKHGKSIEMASKEVKADSDIVIAASKNGYCMTLEEALESLKGDKGVVLAAVSLDGFQLCHASVELKGDKDVVMAAVQSEGFALKWASEALKCNREVVLGALGNDPWSLQFVSDELKGDREIIQAACQKDPEVFQFASEELRADQDFGLSLRMDKHPLELEHASDKQKNDKQLVLKAVTANADAYNFASKALQGDRDVAMAAVTNNGFALQLLPTNLQADHGIVKAAVSKTGMSLQHACTNLKANKEIVLAAVRNDGYALWYASKDLRAAKDVVMTAAAQNAGAFMYASSALKEDREVVLTAVSNDGLFLQHMPEKLRADKEIVLAAVGNQPEALKYALDGLNQDNDCWIAAKLWNADNNVRKQMNVKDWSQAARIALSTKFSLSPDSHSSANSFTVLLNKTPYFRDGNFVIYSPNAFNKDTCDPEWTRLDWPCRGTFDSCRKTDPSLKTGVPSDNSCWRYSYRYHLEEAKRTNGFMLQVVDFDAATNKHFLGKGQEIEAIMAKEVGTNIVRVYQPVDVPSSGSTLFIGHTFGERHLAVFAACLKRWHASKRNEKDDWEIHFRGNTTEVKSLRDGESSPAGLLRFLSNNVPVAAGVEWLQKP